jgi:hypothetical protein
MGLVWTFMGVSPVYQMLSGAAEVAAGVLLFWRRTRLLGATLAAIVMTNVVMLNYLYDVPVKLFSSHLLLAAVALISLDRARLSAVFVRNRPAPAAELGPVFATRRGELLATGLKLALLCTFVGAGSWKNAQLYRVFGGGREHHELWGIHDVHRFVLDGEELPALRTNEQRWRALIIDHPEPIPLGGREWPGQVEIQTMDDVVHAYSVEIDDAAHTMILRTSSSADPIAELAWTRPRRFTLVLTGTWKGAPVEIHLRERDLDSLILTHRGFHWINEVPYNR